jgi:hypothetical protein
VSEVPPSGDEARDDSDDQPGRVTPQRPEAISLERRFASRRTLLSFLLGFSLIAFFLSRLGPETIAESWQIIRGADPRLYAAALLAYYTAFPVRALRWRILLRNSGEPDERIPSVRDLSEIIYLSWFANSVVPAKLGDVYRGWLLRRTGGVSWSHGMGTVVAERLLDAVVLVALLLLAAVLAYGDVLGQAAAGAGGLKGCIVEGARAGDTSCVLLDLLLVGALVALALTAGLLLFARHGRRLAPLLPYRVVSIYTRFSDALVLSFGRFPSLIVLSVLAWTAEGAAFYLVGAALGYRLPLPLVVFFSLLQAFITVIPLTPGGLGFEVFLAAALALRGMDQAVALAMTALYRTISYLSLIAGGAVVYTVSKKTK